MRLQREQLDPNQRAILWLAGARGGVAIGRSAHKFMWSETRDGVTVSCLGIQIERLTVRGFGRMEAGRFVLSDKGAARVRMMSRAPKRIDEARISHVPFWLTDAQFEAAMPHFPRFNAHRRVGERARLSGVVHALRHTLPFAQLPPVYGPGSAIARRFVRWAGSGVLDDILARLVEERDGGLRLVVSEGMLRAHRSARRHVAAGCFPIMAPVEEDCA